MKNKIFMTILILTLFLTFFNSSEVYGDDYVKGQSIIAEDQVKASIGLNFPGLDITWLPEDIAKESLKENYGDFVSLTLLEKWQNDPANAPGRVSSSPWPERIDIVSVEKLSDSEYEVYGNIIYMTSVEMIQGGIAGSKTVTLNIKNIEGKWLIDDLTNSSMSELMIG